MLEMEAIKRQDHKGVEEFAEYSCFELEGVMNPESYEVNLKGEFMYQFTEDIRIGIEEIDEEHERFFSLINEAQAMLDQSGIDVKIVATEVIKRLKDYAITHFAHEEAYMKKIRDSELSSQKIEHADFAEKMNAINVEVLDDDATRKMMSELLEYLSRWLFKHIIGSDSLIGKFESQYAFTSKFHVGVEQIDAEHARLFEIIADANQVIYAEFLHDKYDEIVRILAELREYTRVHFRDEEAIMERINYPELPAQKKAHASFEEKLAEINLEEIDDNQQEYLEELVDYLITWLSVHILHMDKKIGEFMAIECL